MPLGFMSQIKQTFLKNIKSILRPYRQYLLPLRGWYAELVLSLLRANRLIQYSLFRESEGFANYSIVSACYNVAPYIDEFIDSIVKQTLSFNNNIQLILVNDGSTDKTYEKMEKWAKKYPANIQIITQKNSGQSAARNTGLKYAKNTWVGFIDPDDFVDVHLFRRIDYFLEKHSNQDICMVGMNIVQFIESGLGFYHNHPLNYKFKKRENIVPILSYFSVISSKFTERIRNRRN